MQLLMQVLSPTFSGPIPRTQARIFSCGLKKNPYVRLVVGGKLSEELNKVSKYRKWAQQAILSGKMKIIDKGQIDEREGSIREAKVCASNDHHVIALAQVSGARLLYSNDEKLQNDFNNSKLINSPRGRVYTTNHGRTTFSTVHRNLLERTDLCKTRI